MMNPEEKPAARIDRVAALDGWRGVAIIAVLFGHFVTTKWLNSGRLGVELFFALSGSLIGGILFRSNTKLTEFAPKRIARIVPSMWFFVLVVVLITSLQSEVNLLAVAPTLFGLGNYWSPPIEQLSHLWSVCVELQGYLALGMVAWVCRACHWRAHRLIFIVVALSWCLIITAALKQTDEYYSTYWRFEYRMTTMLMAAALMSIGSERFEKWPAWWIFLLAGIALQFKAVPDAFKYTIGSALIAFACVHLRNAKEIPAWLQNRLLIQFGVASYSIYLWQQIFYAEARNMGHLLALSGAVLTGFAAHYLWDRRLHKLCLRWLLPNQSH